MHNTAFAAAGKSLLLPIFLSALAGCSDAAAPVPEETAKDEPTVEAPAPIASEMGASQFPDEPMVAPGPEASPNRAPAPAARKTTPAPVATPAAPIATPVADPHTGHDMSTMSDEDMKAMGHDR